MEKFRFVLSQCPLFDGILVSEIEQMLKCLYGRVFDVKKGEIILREGESANQIGVVLDGTVQVIRQDYDGNRSVLTSLGPAEIFAESYAFSDAQELPVSVVAQSDGKILMIDSTRVTSCCTNACHFHNQLIFNLLRTVSNKNLTLHQKIEVTSKRTTREKLLAYLSFQAKLNRSNAFNIPFDRQQLADYLDVDRSGLSAQISQLRKEGVLESEKNYFRLRDVEENQ